MFVFLCLCLFVKQKTAYEMRISDWSSDVCSSDLVTPHKAIYNMALRSGGSGDIADVRGTMEFKWADSCDGWTVDQRSVMTFLYNTGDEVDLGWNLVSWESKDGLSYRFYVRKFQNGEMYEELRGDARLDGGGKTGIARYTQIGRAHV